LQLALLVSKRSKPRTQLSLPLNLHGVEREFEILSRN
jgi:hypothetical protein